MKNELRPPVASAVLSRQTMLRGLGLEMGAALEKGARGGVRLRDPLGPGIELLPA